MQEIETDKFKDLGELVTALNKITSQAGGENYTLTFDDVKTLHNKYLPLATDIKGRDKQAGAPYVNVIEGCLIAALKHEAQDISKIRSFENESKVAKLEAKKTEETPRTWRPWWWPFKLQCNRAQQLVDDEAAINADFKHNLQQAELDRLEKELEQIEGGYELDGYLTFRQRRKFRRKISRHKRAAARLEELYRAAEQDEGDKLEEPAAGEPAGVQNTETDNVAAVPLNATAATMGDDKPAKKPKKKAVTPVVIVEQLPGQLPGQMSIENADTAK